MFAGLMWTQPPPCCRRSSHPQPPGRANHHQLLVVQVLLLLPLLLAFAAHCTTTIEAAAAVATPEPPRPDNTTRVLVLLERDAELLTRSFHEYARVLGVHRAAANRVVFRHSNGDLWGQLNEPNYSTIIYAMEPAASATTRAPREGLCAMGTELSGWHRKRVLFWPCPTQPQSVAESPVMMTTRTTVSTMERTQAATTTTTTTTASRTVDAVRHVLEFMNATQISIITKYDAEWLLPVSVAVSLSGIPHTVAYHADFFDNASAICPDVPGSVIISSIEAATPLLSSPLERHVLHSTHTRALLIDLRADAISRHPQTCTGHETARVWPHNPRVINSTTPSRSQSPIYLLTLLSTDFRQYLKLLINQHPIVRRHHDEGDDSAAAAAVEDHQWHRRRSPRHRSRRAIEIANEIKTISIDAGQSMADVPGESVSTMNGTTATNTTATNTTTITSPTTANTSLVQLSPEIISKIKQFYSPSGVVETNGATAHSIYDYCQRFVAGSYGLDANTTAAVCDILLQDDTVPVAASLVDDVGNEDDEDKSDVDDDDDDYRGDHNDYGSDNGEMNGNASTARPPSVVVIHATECLMAIKWFALFDLIIANVTSGNRSNAGHPPKTTAGSRPEFNLLRYSMADGWQWPPVLRVDDGRFAAATDEPPPGAPLTPAFGGVAYVNWVSDGLQMFWHCGTHCWTVTSLVVLMLVLSMAGCAVSVIAVRKYLLKQRLSHGPNKIVLSANDFVFPVEGRRVDEGIEAMLCCWLQQLTEFGAPEVERPDLLKGSIGSLKNLGLTSSGAMVRPGGVGSVGGGTGGVESCSGSLSKHRHMMDMRARYNGDLVQLKEMPMGPSGELKSRAMDHLVMTHGLRHENVNPLIGWLNDPNRNAMVFECCSRGSLQDVLIMDDIKLDWSFRLSLLTDLVRGMRYLHSTPMRVHGALTSRNCVVDARWVLKITDYGLQTFRDIQGIVTPPRTTKELLWTAPEIVRRMRGSPAKWAASQMGDVYSFGIIMQEVVVRGEPYCMLSLTPDEIIAKIEKPPPLIRPSVSKGAAPPEAINIMRQCWAESPEMRPDFNSVYERFKQLNQGRKVNFVDTMFQMLEKYSNNLEELIRERTGQLEMERKKTEQLLNRMLPNSVAEKLKMGLSVEPEEFSDVTIYFSDIVGFTTIAAHCTPVEVVDLLNDLYTCFDDTINAYSVYKVETIGDAYMVVSGLPVRSPDHAEQIATMALDLLHQSGSFHVKHLPDVPLQLRIGLHTGPCCAGVVGLTMPRYCLFGDTVNTASRMESTGSSWRIHLSEATRERLVKAGGYQLEPRGPIEIKGKGLMNTYWLLGKSGFDKVLPTPPPIGESHGLAECLLRNVQPTHVGHNRPADPATTSVVATATAATSSVPSSTVVTLGRLSHQTSSQSSSQCGEVVDVKVEITPPHDSDCDTGVPPPAQQQTLTNSFSLDSNAALCLADFNKPFASPQIRKLSELPPNSQDSCSGGMLLNAVGSLGRYSNAGLGGGSGVVGGGPANASNSNSANKLYKKIEEMIDLSSPYNHYRCLSACPSESNLTQYNQTGEQHRYAYAGGGVLGVSMGGVGGGSSTRLESRPGSSRLLRRQFSLDRDDCSQLQQQQQQPPPAHQTYRLNLDIPTLQEHRTSPTNSAKSMGNSLGLGGQGGGSTLGGRLLKQHSTSVAVDLEKIEEIPISPTSVLSGSRSNSGLQSQASEDTTGSRTPERSVMAVGARATSAAPTSRNGNEISLTVDALIVR